MACTSAAERHIPFQSLRAKVKQASSIRNVSKPRLPIRTVASMELFVKTPGDQQKGVPCRAQSGFQIGADEGAVGFFDDDGLDR